MTIEEHNQKILDLRNRIYKSLSERHIEGLSIIAEPYDQAGARITVLRPNRKGEPPTTYFSRAWPNGLNAPRQLAAGIVGTVLSKLRTE